MFSNNHSPFPPAINEMHEEDMFLAIINQPIAAVDNSNPVWDLVPNVQYEGQFTTDLPTEEFMGHVNYCNSCDRDSEVLRLMAEHAQLRVELNYAYKVSETRPNNSQRLDAAIVACEQLSDEYYAQAIARSNTIHNA